MNDTIKIRRLKSATGAPVTTVDSLKPRIPVIKSLLRIKAEAAPLAAIIAFFVAFFWPAIFSGMCFVSGDALVYSYPMREVAWKMIRDGALPLWTPHILSGYPLLSMAQLGIGYPLTWGYLFLPGHIAEGVYVLAPYLLAPAFFYAYLRTVNCSRLGALLGGLSFSYGGMMVSGLGQTAMFTNAVMWLPLMLIAIERARTGRFPLCLAGAGAAYAMSVLTGLGQAFLYVALIAVGYGAFLCLAPKAEIVAPPEGGNSRLARLLRFKPLMVGLGGVAIGAGVAAFQIFETMRAQRLSHRSALTYESFSGMAFTPLMIWESFINPIHHYNHEATTYVALMAALFALAPIIAAVYSRSLRRHLRVYFWLLLAAIGLLMMMGGHTPLYRLLYHIPVINLFRHPWRHAFEWTLGVSMLAAFGWDMAARLFTSGWDMAARLSASARDERVFKTSWRLPGNIRVDISKDARNEKGVKTRWRWRKDLIGALLLTACVVATGAMVWLANSPVRSGQASWPIGLGETGHTLAKFAYTLLLLITVWWGWGWRKTRPAGGGALLAIVILLACFWEQYLLASSWWFSQNKLASHFEQVSPPSRFLEGRAPLEGRIYASLSPWGSPDFRRYEPHNLPARHGFHDASGYEPLATKRYCQVFGGCPDFETPMFNAPHDPQILDPRWLAPDLLNVRFIIQSSPQISLQPGQPDQQRWTEKEGVRFASADAKQFDLGPGSLAILAGPTVEVDTLSLVTVTTDSTLMPQGAKVADLTVHTADGRRIDREIRIGIDTAEWAYERADVKPVIRHSLPRIYARIPGDSDNSFQALRYWTKFDLGGKVTVDHVELKSVADVAKLVIFKATSYDSSSDEVSLLSRRPPAHWRQVYDQDEVQIYENPHALPRAWMVPSGEVVSAVESLRRIRGESPDPFDPRETALLELDGRSGLDLPQGEFKAPAEARIVSYEPNSMAVETVADKSAILVVSESNYPGWEATIDGQPAEILYANYLLRGVIVPEGRHRVEMRYTAPAASRGAIITAVTLLALAGMVILGQRNALRVQTRLTSNDEIIPQT